MAAASRVPYALRCAEGACSSACVVSGDVRRRDWWRAGRSTHLSHSRAPNGQPDEESALDGRTAGSLDRNTPLRERGRLDVVEGTLVRRRATRTPWIRPVWMVEDHRASPGWKSATAHGSDSAGFGAWVCGFWRLGGRPDLPDRRLLDDYGPCRADDVHVPPARLARCRGLAWTGQSAVGTSSASPCSSSGSGTGVPSISSFRSSSRGCVS